MAPPFATMAMARSGSGSMKDNLRERRSSGRCASCRSRYGRTAITFRLHILRSHIPDCAVQTHRVVAIHVAFNQAPSILHRQRRERMYSLLKSLEPSFQFSVRLRIKRRSAYASHSEDTDQLLEIPGDEMRHVVGNDPGFCLRAFLLGLTDERSPRFQLRQDSSGFHC